MQRIAALLILLAALGGGAPATAQDLTVGVAAPLSGGFSILGRQLADGARLAARMRDARVEEADTACTAEGGAAAARALIARRVTVVVGFLCTEAIEAALPLLKAAGIATVTPGVRTATLTDQRLRTGFPVFRTAPRTDGEREAVARLLVPRWRSEFFAIVDDGTIHGRELAETLRAAAEISGLKPVFVDTFRPQLDNQIGLAGRLRRAGATHVFVGGDRSDIAILARDADRMGFALTAAGGETLRTGESPVPLAAGTLMVGLPAWEEIASPEALAALAEAGLLPEGYVLPGMAAAEAAIAAARAGAVSVGEALAKGSFDTALGPFSFDGKGDLATDFYRLYRFDGGRFAEIE